MNIALILADGTDTCRGYGDPSQYLTVGGKMIITHCIQAFGAHRQIDAIQIVAHEEWREMICRQMSEAALRKFKGFSRPEPTWQHSMFYGLKAMGQYAKKSDIVIIHESIRPLVSASVLSACLEACKEHDGAFPALPVEDTVYLEKDGRISAVLGRGRAYAGQEPAAFRLGKYYAVCKRLMPERIDRINDPVEPAAMAGLDIAMVPGDKRNFKIIARMDFERLKGCLNIQNRKIVYPPDVI